MLFKKKIKNMLKKINIYYVLLSLICWIIGLGLIIFYTKWQIGLGVFICFYASKLENYFKVE